MNAHCFGTVAGTIATGFVHGAVAIGYDGMTDDFVTGYTLLGTMIVITLFSVVIILRSAYNVFKVVHHSMPLVVVFSGVLHGGVTFLVGVGLWAIDLAVRFGLLSVMDH